MIRKFAFKTRLLLAFSLTVLFLITVGGVNYWALSRTAGKYGHVADVNLPNVLTLAKMRAAALDVRVLINKTALPNTDRAELEKLVAGYKEDKATFVEQDKIYQSIEFQPGEQQVYDAMVVAVKKYQSVTDEIMDLAQKGTPEAKSRVLYLLANDARIAGNLFFKSIETLMQVHDAEAHRWAKEATTTANRAMWIAAGLILVGALLAMVLGWVLATSLTRGITRIIDDLSAAATQTLSASGQVSASSQTL
ncbi:MAG TPA: MCP four helix bundle domain-containing protein, partial [bacterium]